MTQGVKMGRLKLTKQLEQKGKSKNSTARTDSPGRGQGAFRKGAGTNRTVVKVN